LLLEVHPRAQGRALEADIAEAKCVTVLVGDVAGGDEMTADRDDAILDACVKTGSQLPALEALTTSVSCRVSRTSLA
jgi:hypothetical protein